MSDLISRKDVIGVIDNAEKIYVNNLPTMIYKQSLEQAIMTIPTQPQRTGRWIPQDHNKSNGMISTAVFYYPKCSECGHSGNYDMNFCPNCGADMREGES